MQNPKVHYGRIPIVAAYFLVTGNDDFDPASCTSAFGIAPTEVLVRGQLRPPPRPSVDRSEWRLEYRRESHDINEVFAQLLDSLWPHKDQVRGFVESKSLKVSFICHVKIFEDRPLYELSCTTLERMCYFSGDFGMDIFDLSASS